MDDKASASSGDSLQALLASDDARMDALVANDLTTLADLLHPELVYVHSNGSRDSRDSLLGDLREGSLVYQHFSQGDRSGVVAGTTGIIFGSVVIRVARAGQPRELDLRYQSAWTSEGGHWQLIGWLSCLR